MLAARAAEKPNTLQDWRDASDCASSSPALLVGGQLGTDSAAVILSDVLRPLKEPMAASKKRTPSTSRASLIIFAALEKSTWISSTAEIFGWTLDEMMLADEAASLLIGGCVA
jgi:hypothetical protein